jgi:hypothetical protein
VVLRYGTIPAVDLQDAMRAAKLQPSPKFERIKPMIPSMIQHLKNIGWIEGGGVKGQ